MPDKKIALHPIVNGVEDKNTTLLPKTTWDAIDDAPVIPTKTSQLTNDSGFVTPSDLTGKEDVSNKASSLQSDSTTEYPNVKAVKDYVNSSINAYAAYYITKDAQGNQFNTVAELNSATVFYSGGTVRVPTKNDYCIVKKDENHGNLTSRYSYNNQWEFQYSLNETAFTQGQLNALNSGITSSLVGKFNGYDTSKQDKLVSGTNVKTINGQSILGTGDIQGLEFYEVTSSNGKFYHGSEELNYSKLVDKFNDDKYFLYLKKDNLIYIPSIETNDSLAFSSAWTRREEVGDAEYAQPYISRTIINSQNVVNSEQTGLQSAELMLDSFDDYEEQYGSKMYPSAKAINDALAAFSELFALKQDALTPGDNITIENNVISAAGGKIPTITLTSPRIVSFDPLVVRLTDEQAAIVENSDNKLITFNMSNISANLPEFTFVRVVAANEPNIIHFSSTSPHTWSETSIVSVSTEFMTYDVSTKRATFDYHVLGEGGANIVETDTLPDVGEEDTLYLVPAGGGGGSDAYEIPFSSFERSDEANVVTYTLALTPEIASKFNYEHGVVIKGDNGYDPTDGNYEAVNLRFDNIFMNDMGTWCGETVTPSALGGYEFNTYRWRLSVDAENNNLVLTRETYLGYPDYYSIEIDTADDTIIISRIETLLIEAFKSEVISMVEQMSGMEGLDYETAISIVEQMWPMMDTLTRIGLLGSIGAFANSVDLPNRAFFASGIEGLDGQDSNITWVAPSSSSTYFAFATRYVIDPETMMATTMEPFNVTASMAQSSYINISITKRNVTD